MNIKTPRVQIQPWLGPSLAVVVFITVAFFLYRQLHAIHWQQVMSLAKAMPLPHISLSLLLMVAAYWSLTLYEILAVRYAKAKVSYRRTALTAVVAYAVGHNLGFASLSGGAIRYRLYSLAGLSATQIGLIVLFGAVTFGLGMCVLLSVSLFIEPAGFWASMGFSASLIKALSACFLLVVCGYCLWALWLRQDIQIKQLRVKAPSPGQVTGQFLVSTLDLTLACAVLYVLLPESHSSFIQFLPLYLIAIGLSTISNIPGGLGVFESVLLLGLPTLPKEALLSAILVYRVIYYLIPLTLSLAGFVLHELHVHRQRFRFAVKGLNDWFSALAPAIAATVVFLSGAVLLISGATPAIDSRIQNLKQMLPLPLLELSHLVGSLCGVFLLILSRGLYLRLRGAMHIVLILLLISIVASLAKGFDYEETLVLLIAGLILWSTRDTFYRHTSLLNERFTAAWIISVLIVIGASVWIGIIAYRHVEYSHALWWQFAFDHDAPRMLRATVSVLIVVAALMFWKLLHDAGSRRADQRVVVDIAQIKTIVGQSSDTQANLALTGDKQFLLHPQGDAFIMYQNCGNSMIAMGDPIGNSKHGEELAWQFRSLCDRYNARPVFYQITDRHLPIYIDMGMALAKLGEEARVPLRDFSLEGRERADLRQAQNRFKKLGAHFEIIPAAEVPLFFSELKAVSDDWLKDKATHEKAFSLGSFTRDYLVNFDIATVRLNGLIVAFTNLWRGANKEELSLDLMRYTQQPTKGVMDYLFTEVMLWGKSQGYRYFSLGMAPLSGLENHPLAPVWHKVGTFIFQQGENFYNFEGLRHYKAKYQPEWLPRYIATRSGFNTPAALLDTTRLISGGLLKTFTK